MIWDCNWQAHIPPMLAPRPPWSRNMKRFKDFARKIFESAGQQCQKDRVGGCPTCVGKPKDMGWVLSRKRLGGGGATRTKKKPQNHQNHLGKRGQSLPAGNLLAATTGQSYQRVGLVRKEVGVGHWDPGLPIWEVMALIIFYYIFCLHLAPFCFCFCFKSCVI